MIDTEMSAERFAQLAPAIQEKIKRTREAAERREQKKEDRETLKLWLQYKEIEAIPVKARSRDEHNLYQRLRRQWKKLEEKGEQTIAEKVDERVKSAEQFWALNSIGQQKLGEWRERQERVHDMLAWMDRIEDGTETPELCEENFVSLEEGAQDILDDIEAHGTTRLGYIFADEDIHADWYDGYFTGQAFWRTPEVFRALCAENEPTRVYVTTGILIALPDWRVYEFLRRLSGSDTDITPRPHYWSARQVAELVGWKFNSSPNANVNRRHVRSPEL